MKFEIELNDEDLKVYVNQCLKDYILDNRALQAVCRQAVYSLVADAAQEVLKTHKEEMSELVLREFVKVLKEQPE